MKPFRDEAFQDKFCQVAFVDLFDEEDKLERDLGERIYQELLVENTSLQMENNSVKGLRTS
jgi:hypothetical protein